MISRRLMMLVLCGVLGMGEWSVAQDKVVVSVWPDKLLYDPGETAIFDVTATNQNKQPVKGRLTVKVIWEMDDTQSVLDQPIELGPGEKKSVKAEWKTRDVLGCEARADFLVGDQNIATGSEYFNVCPSKDMQRVGIYSGGSEGTLTSTDKANMDAITRGVRKGRECYGNFFELFGWPPDTYSNLAPEGEEWLSVYGWNKRAALETLITEAHKQGLKVMVYAAGYAYSLKSAELVRRHPDWFLYKENGLVELGPDIPKMDWQRNPDHRAFRAMAGWACSAFPNFAKRPALDYGVQQLIASTRQFGWDGVRFDGHYVLYPPNAYDVTGKPLPIGKDGAAIDKFNTDYTRKELTKVFPNYLFMYNSGYEATDIDEECRDGGGVGNEIIRASHTLSTSPLNRWKGFAETMANESDQARMRGGYAYSLLPCAWDICPNVDRIQYPLMFASGNHPWFAGAALDRPYDCGGSHYPIQKDLFRFATRFSAVIWGRGIEHVKEKESESLLEVSSSKGTVWWTNFVHRRPLAGGRKQLVVHLINEPPSLTIEAKDQQLPAPIADVTVKFKVKVGKVWAASSKPEVSYQKVPVENGTIKVPELKIWTMVIAEMGDK